MKKESYGQTVTQRTPKLGSFSFYESGTIRKKIYLKVLKDLHIQLRGHCSSLLNVIQRKQKFCSFSVYESGTK